MARASGTAGRAGIAGLPDAATPVFFPEAPDDADSDAEPARTLDALRNTGDPNDVGRTPILGTDDIPVTPGEWPLGYPLQGVPRVAVTLSLQYVYNEAEDQWERDTGFSSGGGGNATTVMEHTTDQTITANNTPQQVTLDSVAVDDLGGADTGADRIEVPSSGLYLLSGSVLYDNFDGFADLDSRVQVNGSIVVGHDTTAPDAPSLSGETVTMTKPVPLAAGDAVTLTASANNTSDPVVVGSAAESHLTVMRVRP